MNVFQRLTHPQALAHFVKYFGASAIALAIDYGVYWWLAQATELTLPQAAALGYLAGLVAAYFLISRHIFNEGWLSNKKFFEALLFASSGLFGTAVTYLTVKLYTTLIAEDINGAKLSAIGVSFFSVYAYRRYIVFRKERSGR
jgi:putative flippase GtrA